MAMDGKNSSRHIATTNWSLLYVRVNDRLLDCVPAVKIPARIGVTANCGVAEKLNLSNVILVEYEKHIHMER